jgi:hypothetical protein
VTFSFSYEDLILLPALIGYTIWWVRDLRKGSRIRRWTLSLHLLVYGLAAFYVWAVSLGEIALVGAASSPLTWLWTIVLTAVVVIATEAGLSFGARSLVLERTSGGAWQYRGPVNIALFWLALYLTRFVLEDSLLRGFSVFLPSGSLPAGVPVGTFVAVVLVVASIYLLSFGFMLGISLSVWDRHRRQSQAVYPGPAPPTESAVPVPPPPAPRYSIPRSLVLRAPGSVGMASPAGAYQGFSALAPASLTLAASPSGAVPAASIEPVGYCTQCGCAAASTERFCGGCGTPLTTSPLVQSPSPRAAPSTPAPVGPAAPGLAGRVGSFGALPANAGMWSPTGPPIEPDPSEGSAVYQSAPAFCGQCGEPVPSGERYCGNCGAASPHPVR